MIVADASILANAIGDDGSGGDAARTALSGNDLSIQASGVSVRFCEC